MDDKKKQREIIFVFIYVITALIMIFHNEIFEIRTTTPLRPAGNIFENLPHLLAGGNLSYSLFFLGYVKHTLITFLIDLLRLFYNNNVIIDIENALFNLNLFF